MQLDAYREFILELAERSGDLIRPYFGASPHELGIELKKDESPVTRADRGAEELMRELIHARFPDHGIIGEEYGEERPDAEFVWSLDPIDGTISFASASPLFGTLIALLHDGVPVLGAINQPVLRQICLGDGESTTLNGKPVHVRQTPALKDATLLVTDLVDVPQYQDGPAFDALMREVRWFRTWGDCYGYLLVATGHADIMCDPVMNAWDIAPLIPIVRGAGGVVTGWRGEDPVGASSLLATTSRSLHDEILGRLNP